MYYLPYNIVIITLCIVLSPIILLMLVIVPKFRAGFFQKLGFYGKDNRLENSIVFHAVSLGETNAVAPVVKAFKQRFPDKKIVFTNTTATGNAAALKALTGTADKIVFFPFDFFFSVNSFFDTFNPEKVIIAETEIWPGFVAAAKKRGIKVYIANGRISPHSYNNYKKFKFFFKNVFENYEEIIMQTDGDRQRIIDSGAPEDKTFTGGNIKFDIKPNLSEEKINELRKRFNVEGERIFIAASTHEGEDEIVIKCFKALKEKVPNLKLLLAPRHPERFEKVFELLVSSGLNPGKVSDKADFKSFDVILGDTTGELPGYFSFCEIAFIGGSFSNTGGHNPLEANIWDKPALSGPTVFNFKDVYKILQNFGAAKAVNTPEELTSECLKLLTNKDCYEKACNAAKKVFEQNSGATNYLLEKIS